MSNTVRRLLTCAALAIVGYFAVSLIATLAQLANAAELAFPGSGRPLFWALAAAFTALLAAPIVLWRRLPKPLQPPAEGEWPAWSYGEKGMRGEYAADEVLEEIYISLTESDNWKSAAQDLFNLFASSGTGVLLRSRTLECRTDGQRVNRLKALNKMQRLIK